MTATVSNVAPSEFINGSDMLYALQSVRGQLWERVAGGQHISDAYTWRGPLAIYSGTATPKCSGIICAGERVK